MILIIAAIAIPNYIQSKMRADEGSAVQCLPHALEVTVAYVELDDEKHAQEIAFASIRSMRADA